ncbi:neuropilin-2-like isoform X2 [Haliotis asinina]|uniref:neuropilin-2-like isoform X2 n=1 Tax=Haliotis asinina TaxID=109174 RepID=UPI003532314C
METTWRHGLYLVLLWVLLCSATLYPVASRSDGPCGPRQLTAGSQPKYITSPCYPRHITECETLRVLRCTFDITAKEGERIQAVVLDFNGKDGLPCRYDHVIIFDGIPPPTRQLNEGCTAKTNFTTTSSGRYMRVELSMMFTLLDRGFKMMYTSGSFQAVSKHVDLTATSYIQFILSPGYPDLYGGEYHRTWRIYSGSLTGVIHMSLEKSQLPYNPNCRSDYLAVYDGYDTTKTSLAKWCGEERPSVNSSQAYMFIEFRASGAKNRGVFVIEYSIIEELAPPNPHYPQIEFDYGGVVIPTAIQVTPFLFVIVCCIGIYSWKSFRNRRSNTACAVMTTTRASNPVESPSQHLSSHEMTMLSTGTGGDTELPPYNAVVQNPPPPSYDSLFGSNNGKC